jgi:hypothetical protein
MAAPTGTLSSSFVDEVCGQPEVACVTYQEAIRRLKPADGSAS